MLLERLAMYKKALRRYAYDHAANYLNGGHQFMYGINKFDWKSWNVSYEEAASEYYVLFDTFIKELTNCIGEEVWE